MASRNAANSGTPVTCNHDELIAAVWGEPDSWDRSKVYTADNLRDLVFELRKRLRPHDDLIETIPGLGYLLHTRAR
jgi:DNA-binding winged helix-turn-helix (wHTH) protein